MSDELRPVQSFFVDEELGVALPAGPVTLPVYGPSDRYGPEAGPDVPLQTGCQCLDPWDECWCFEP